MAVAVAERYCKALTGDLSTKRAFITKLAQGPESLEAVIDLALITPMHTASMPKIVPHLVVYLKSVGKTAPGDALHDKTLSTEAYIDLLYARRGDAGGSPLASMSLAQLLAALKRSRLNISYMYQLLRNLPPGALRRFVVLYFHRGWKFDGVAAAKAQAALCNKQRLTALKQTYAMTKDPVLLARSVVEGRAPELSGRLGVACVLLNKTVYHTAEEALAALPREEQLRAAKRDRDGGVYKGAVATVKLDGYSVNLCFYREAAVDGGSDGDVCYKVQFRTRGETWSIGAGVAAIAASVARALQADPGFSQMIIGGEVCVTDRESGVMYPSVDMHDWKRPDRALTLVVYHMILYNDRKSKSIAEDHRLIETVLTDEVLQRVRTDAAFGHARLLRVTDSVSVASSSVASSSVAGAGASTTTLPMTRAVKNCAELAAYFDAVKAAGLEGVVLSNRAEELILGEGRNANILKMKPRPEVVSAVVYGYKLRASGFVKELMVAVREPPSLGSAPEPARVYAYATVGNLSDAARKALATSLPNRYTCKPGHELQGARSWFVGPPSAAMTDMVHLMADSGDALPEVRIRGYPSSAVSRKYTPAPPACGVPTQLTFAKLVPDSVADLVADLGGGEADRVGASSGAKSASVWGDPFRAALHQLAELATVDNADTLLGLTVSVTPPPPGAVCKDSKSYQLAHELTRLGAKVVSSEDGLEVDRAVDAEDEEHYDWVIQCAVFGKLCEFPGAAPVPCAQEDVRYASQQGCRHSGCTARKVVYVCVCGCGEQFSADKEL